jgi:hypothetical protein
VITPFIEGLSDTDAEGNPLSQEELENEKNVLKPYPYELNEKQIEKGLRSDKFQRFFNGELQGVFPVALLDEEYQKALGAKTKTVYLSDKTRDIKKQKHPDISALNYKQLNDYMKNAQLILHRAENKLIFIYEESAKSYLAVTKVNQSKSELYLESLYRVKPKTIIKEIRKSIKVIKDSR